MLRYCGMYSICTLTQGDQFSPCVSVEGKSQRKNVPMFKNDIQLTLNPRGNAFSIHRVNTEMIVSYTESRVAIKFLQISGKQEVAGGNLISAPRLRLRNTNGIIVKMY
jgi:hypothetical protein